MSSKQHPTFPLNSFIQSLLPRLASALGNQCLLCGCPSPTPQALCGDCHTELPWLKHRCYQCSLPLPGAQNYTREHPNQNKFCGQCLSHPPSFKRCWAALAYEHPVAQLIHQFKDRRQFLSGTLLSQLLTEFLKENIHADDLPDVITAVPLHWLRQWRRGFNQSHYLALKLSQSFSLPFIQFCKRQTATEKQQRLKRDQRLQNLKKAFVCQRSPSLITKLKGKHIAIVDDVVTTQATVEALSQSLLKAGASRVDVWAVARTPSPQLQ